MTVRTPLPARPDVVYPDSDGKPMSDNTLQHRWITTLMAGIGGVFLHRPDVFVAGDLLWYPVEGEPLIRAAPDVLVAFGRPKGERGSYKQWVEGGIAPQVVMEVLSPSNTQEEMVEKFHFYDDYGVEEYYVYNPDREIMEGHVRGKVTLRPVVPMNGYVSPRLGIRFDLSSGKLQVFGPENRPFRPVDVVVDANKQLEEQVAQERQRAEQERQRAEQADQRAEQADQRAEQERQRAEQADQRTARLVEMLRALGINPDQ